MGREQRAVLITGASSGIGRATATTFYHAGWKVVAAMRNPKRDAPIVNGDRFLPVTMDVTDEAEIERAVATAVDRFGRIDVLVNNAGYGLTGPLEGITADQLSRQFDVNVFGVAAVIRRVLPTLRTQRDGVIINVSSIGGRIAFPFASAYHATKFAVEGLSESLRFELRSHGIRVKVVEPGGIRTDFITRSQELARHSDYEPQLSRMADMTARLNDRLPGPEGVAAVILRAATDRSDRLRYTAKAGPYLTMNAILPDRLWRRMVGGMLERHAG